jgi:hypothetical protein
MTEQAGATNRLPAASRKRHDNHNLNLEVERALPVACGRPLTFAQENEAAHSDDYRYR